MSLLAEQGRGLRRYQTGAEDDDSRGIRAVCQKVTQADGVREGVQAGEPSGLGRGGRPWHRGVEVSGHASGCDDQSVEAEDCSGGQPHGAGIGVDELGGVGDERRTGDGQRGLLRCQKPDGDALVHQGPVVRSLARAAHQRRGDTVRLREFLRGGGSGRSCAQDHHVVRCHVFAFCVFSGLEAEGPTARGRFRSGRVARWPVMPR